MGASDRENPFCGLCPFGSEQDHLFFGREKIVDQLLIRLRKNRFLGVIGSSGCGKSSLIQAGLIPSLYSGYMAVAGSSWRVVVMRPGADPIGNLALALSQPEFLGHQSGLEDTSKILNEATIMRSNSGLVDCVRLARIPENENLLIVVDQFEELFRFRRLNPSENAREEAVAFVKRLIHASAQTELKIYIVLTMRSDFIGDCNEYPGLPEAINEGLFLVPRMSRNELRSAISGPVMVGNADISQRLLIRLLNDVGDHPDRLPMLQHALMRTWDYWLENDSQQNPIDLIHYEAIGTIDKALSTHEEEAFVELGSDKARQIAEKVFKALTDTVSDSRGVRHPVSLEDLCLICQSSQQDVAAVIDVFRKSGRSFLMPSSDVPLKPETIIDLSHESLMRVWNRLIKWTKEEYTSAQTYMRLARAAVRYEGGTSGLWRDPELQFGLQWLEAAHPTKAWASRYNLAYEKSIKFLDASRVERDRIAEEKRRTRRKRLQTAWGVALILLVFAVYAFIQQQRAEQEQYRAEQHFKLAVQAVDDMLADIAVENSLANIPQTEELRQILLEKARGFYESLQQDSSADTSLQLETAVAHVRLAKIYQLQGEPAKAQAAYELAITQLQTLHREHPDLPPIQNRLGEAYDWYGVHIMPYDELKAEEAYAMSADLHRDLIDRFPENLEYAHEIARVYNNRGILLGKNIERAADSELSFLKAIELFSKLRSQRDNSDDAWRLTRTLNGLGGLLRRGDRNEEASEAYIKAIAIVEDMLAKSPEKRKYREGLARFYNNLGNLYLVAGKLNEALAANTRARELFEELAMPVPELLNEIANSYNTRGTILMKSERSTEAKAAILIAVGQFETLEANYPNFSDDPNLNDRFGGILASLAILSKDEGHFEEAADLMSRAVSYFLKAVNSAASSSVFKHNLSNAYWLLTDFQLRAGNYSAAAISVDLFSQGATNKNSLYIAARLYIRLINLFNRDDLPSHSLFQKAKMIEAYRLTAIQLLDRAVKAGLSIERLTKYSEAGGLFHQLLKRDDFQKILRRKKQ